MRQPNAGDSVTSPLPAAAVRVAGANLAVYEFKHPDTDTENPPAQKTPVRFYCCAVWIVLYILTATSYYEEKRL